jgi:hypothetical protein
MMIACRVRCIASTGAGAAEKSLGVGNLIDN